jgi:hypothetical protein
MPIGKYGWKDKGPPDIDAENLEGMLGVAGAYTDSLAANVANGSALPGSVVNSSLNELGEVEGTIEPNISGSKNVVTLIAKGNITIKPPINTVKTVEVVELWLTENAKGGYIFTFEGFSLIGEKPTLSTAANAVNLVQLVTYTKGSTWSLVGLQAGKEGPKGEKGEKGIEGREGLNRGLLLLPKKIKSYESTSTSTITELAANAESFDRGLLGNTYTLISGTPVLTALEVPAKTVIKGIAFYVSALETETPTRTHLWIALLNSKFEVLRRGLDYTSTTNTPLGATSIRGLFLEASYETSSEAVLLYAVLCEVMSAGKPITIGTREATAASEVEPTLSGNGNAALTTPASLPATVTVTPTIKRPWMALI